jgi:hypothetical protein
MAIRLRDGDLNNANYGENQQRPSDVGDLEEEYHHRAEEKHYGAKEDDAGRTRSAGCWLSPVRAKSRVTGRTHHESHCRLTYGRSAAGPLTGWLGAPEFNAR